MKKKTSPFNEFSVFFLPKLIGEPHQYTKAAKLLWLRVVNTLKVDVTKKYKKVMPFTLSIMKRTKAKNNSLSAVLR